MPKLYNMYQKAFLIFKNNFYLFVPLSILLQTCIASIAVYLIFIQGVTPLHMILLLICIISSSAYNGAIIACLPIKTIFHLLLISIFINISFIVLYL